MAKQKRGDNVYNADTNQWEKKKPKTKPTPASNTRKKMKAAAAKKASTPAKKKAPAKKAPTPATRKKAPTPATRKKKAPVEGVTKLREGRAPIKASGGATASAGAKKGSGRYVKAKKKGPGDGPLDFKWIGELLHVPTKKRPRK